MRMPVKICVIGLGSNVPSDLVKVARETGKVLAEHDDFILLTGACNGVSYEVTKAVKEHKPYIRIIGFSPATDENKHIREYNYPVEYFDEIRFIGGGRQERSIRMVSECDRVIMIGGQMGSLIEFCIAYRAGKKIAIFSWPSSASDKTLIKTIARFCYEDGCASFAFKENPKSLVKEVLG